VGGEALDGKRVLRRPLKMVRPALRPGIEEGHHLPRRGIYPIDVRPLAGIVNLMRKLPINW
jgi:hypothetical protein